MCNFCLQIAMDWKNEVVENVKNVIKSSSGVSLFLYIPPLLTVFLLESGIIDNRSCFQIISSPLVSYFRLFFRLFFPLSLKGGGKWFKKDRN